MSLKGVHGFKIVKMSESKLVSNMSFTFNLLRYTSARRRRGARRRVATGRKGRNEVTEVSGVGSVACERTAAQAPHRFAATDAERELPAFFVKSVIDPDYPPREGAGGRVEGRGGGA